ncbi:QueT transporter family protein [Eubacteriales bacterium OttesenSCG-928-K08]|nr:QueT transporter family protein [Eubacteriales bacterium OttesenSCG-928-K08]
MKTRQIAQSAVIAAIYVLLTWATLPIGSGLIQCRVAEALCVLPCFTPAAIPGLFVGCLISNILSGAVLYDVLFGSLATLAAALLARLVAKKLSPKLSLWLAPLPAVLINALVVGMVLAYAYGLAQEGTAAYVCILSVGAGQVVACYGLGVPLTLLLNRYGNSIFHS